MGEHSKFSTSEVVIGGLFTLCIDGASALLDFTGIGMAISIPLQASTSLGTTLWLKSKGGKRATSLERLQSRLPPSQLLSLGLRYLRLGLNQ